MRHAFIYILLKCLVNLANLVNPGEHIRVLDIPWSTRHRRQRWNKMERSRHKGKKKDHTERSAWKRGRSTERESYINLYTRGNAKEDNVAGHAKNRIQFWVPTSKSVRPVTHPFESEKVVQNRKRRLWSVQEKMRLGACPIILQNRSYARPVSMETQQSVKGASNNTRPYRKTQKRTKTRRFINLVKPGESPKKTQKHTGILTTAIDRQVRVDLKKRLQCPEEIIHTLLRPDIVKW